IGVTPDLSALYTSNAGPHTATVQVALTERHRIGSYEYMNRVRSAMARELPHLSAYFQSGGMVDAVLNQGLAAPIDVQVTSASLDTAFSVARDLASKIRQIRGVSDVYIPQDLDYPSLRLDINREEANELGLNQREVVSNVITALTSNGMIAPSYWVDPKSGNDYMLTVQYPEDRIHTLFDLKNIPLRATGWKDPTLLDAVSHITPFKSPTEVDHYQIQRVIDVYVNPATEDLGRVAAGVRRVIAENKTPAGVRIALRGMVEGMQQSFASFGAGLVLALVLL